MSPLNRFSEMPQVNLETPILNLGKVDSVWGDLYSLSANLIDSTWRQHESGFLAFRRTGVSGIRGEKDSLIVSSGMIVYIPPMTPYFEVSMGHEIDGWFIILPVQLTLRMPAKISAIEGSEILTALCEKVVSWGHAPEQSPAQKRLIETFIDELNSARIAAHLNIPLPSTPGLSRVAAMVIKQPEDMKGLDHWANVAEMSRRSFTRHFAKETGMSFANWKQRVKILASIRMLADGNAVSETALAMGYQSPSSYIAIFRKTLNLTPKQYLLRPKMHAVDPE